MRPGMRFRGSVEVERVTDALLIPIEAVFQSADGPVAYRRTLLGHETLPLELGRRDDQHVEVLSGLDPADEVSLVDLGTKGS